MGNSAFQDQRYDDAITYYTQALHKDENCYGCYSNRSAAYLKSGDLLHALEDAGRCIALKPTFHKGHIRRVAVYHQLEEYQDAVDAYREGLRHCPHDATLRRGLKEAQKKLRLQQLQDEDQVLGAFQF